MGKLNLTTGGATEVSNVPWQSTARSMEDVPHSTDISLFSYDDKMLLLLKDIEMIVIHFNVHHSDRKTRNTIRSNKK